MQQSTELPEAANLLFLRQTLRQLPRLRLRLPAPAQLVQLLGELDAPLSDAIMSWFSSCALFIRLSAPCRKELETASVPAYKSMSAWRVRWPQTRPCC